MIDMGIEPFLVATSTNLIAAQRLVRRICNQLQRAVTRPSRTETARADIGSQSRARPSVTTAPGAMDCGGTGYRGRQGLYEVHADHAHG